MLFSHLTIVFLQFFYIWCQFKPVLIQFFTGGVFRDLKCNIRSGLVSILHRCFASKLLQDVFSSNLPWNHLPCPQLFVRLGHKHLHPRQHQIVESNSRLGRDAYQFDSCPVDRAPAVSQALGSQYRLAVHVPSAELVLRGALFIVPCK